MHLGFLFYFTIFTSTRASSWEGAAFSSCLCPYSWSTCQPFPSFLHLVCQGVLRRLSKSIGSVLNFTSKGARTPRCSQHGEPTSTSVRCRSRGRCCSPWGPAPSLRSEIHSPEPQRMSEEHCTAAHGGSEPQQNTALAGGFCCGAWYRSKAGVSHDDS